MNLNAYFRQWPRGHLRNDERRRIADAVGRTYQTVREWEYDRRKPDIDIVPKLQAATNNLCLAHELNPRCAPVIEAAARARVRAVPNRGKRGPAKEPDTEPVAA